MFFVLLFVPAVNMLTHGSKHHPEEPELSSTGSCLKQKDVASAYSPTARKQKEVILLSLVGSLRCASSFRQRTPQSGVSCHRCMNPVIPLWFGEDDTSILRISAGTEERTVEVMIALECHNRTSPLDSAAIFAESPVCHSQSSLTYGSAIFCDGNWW